jgi:hypothetical protein
MLPPDFGVSAPIWNREQTAARCVTVHYNGGGDSTALRKEETMPDWMVGVHTPRFFIFVPRGDAAFDLFFKIICQ